MSSPVDLRHADLVFIDTEATGHIFGFHELIEVAVVRTSPDAMVARGVWQRTLVPSFPERTTVKAREVTGFSGASGADAEASTGAVWSSFADFCRGSVPVCHNPAFDRAFITLAAAAVGVSDLGVDYHWIGTESLAWPLFKRGALPQLSLRLLCEFLKVEPEPSPHAALGGAEACRRAYQALLSREA